MSKKKRKGHRLGSIILILLEIVFIAIFIYSGYQLYNIYSDYKLASDEYDALADQMVIETDREDAKADGEEEPSVDSPYDYEIPYYEVDLEAAKTQNLDTVGWIILPDSKINYPIVKSKDNEEYLTTTFEGKKANSGAIFMDMYCANDFSNQNTIIYGHNMRNGSMFRALNNMTDKEYFSTHHVFCIDMGSGFEHYEVISCYATTEADLSSWQIGFESQESYEQWLKNVVKRCTYDCVDYNVNKKTITLSTCRGQSGGTGRFIVHLQKK